MKKWYKDPMWYLSTLLAIGIICFLMSNVITTVKCYKQGGTPVRGLIHMECINEQNS